MLEHLAASDEPLTVSQLADGLGISASTCTSILRSLAAAAWVVRDDAKRYRLGPGLFGVAHGLARRYPLGAVDEALEALEVALGYGVSMTSIATDGLTVVHATDRSPATARGHRFPSTPPYGLVAHAWEPADVYEAWLDEAPIPFDGRQRTQMRRAAREVRDRGWFAWRMLPSTGALLDALRASAVADDSPDGSLLHAELGRLGVLLGQSAVTGKDLRGGRPLTVGYLIVPIGSPAPAYQMEVHVLERALPPSRLVEFAAQATATASTLAPLLPPRG